jgi:peptide-methionine (R)-S-oxide reductase
MTMTTKSFVIALLVCLLLESHNAASAFVQQRTIESTSRLTAAVSNDNNDGLSSSSSSSSSSSAADNIKRRSMMQMAILTAATVGMPTTSNAAGTKSRSDGYNVQKTDDEWKTTLTTRQYDILRNGGTERQYSSILEGEERDGTYNCAGCKTPLFLSKEKFHSGTGWPSFASALDGVEIEKKNMLAASLGGSEVRCRNCGGHLGDLFKDGYIFVGTPAAETGKRFCIDGVALNFKSNIDGTEVIGDEVPSRVQYYYN